MFAPLWAVAQGPQRDRVTLRSERSGGRTVIAGEIVDYTGEHLLLRTRAGMAPRSYPADQVVSVETSQTAQHI
ncbi:MAG: hypothetical protein KY476_25520, partial [Planctomycetes bacterium]|nr:hypothetical protein [Planctomycetota bacterium]